MTDRMGLFDLTGRSALVTGAAGGIGSAVAEALARAGASVLLTDIDEAAAGAAAEKLTSAGLRAKSAALDVEDRAAADAAVSRAAALTDGTLHVLVNNAGVTAPAMFEKLDEEPFRRLIDIHVMGAFHCTQAALPFPATDGSEIGRCVVDYQVLVAHARRRTAERLAGQSAGPESSVDKLLMTRAEQRLYETSLKVFPEELYREGGEVLDDCFYSRAASVYGGTSQIQRSIIAKRLLRLSADRRA